MIVQKYKSHLLIVSRLAWLFRIHYLLTSPALSPATFSLFSLLSALMMPISFPPQALHCFLRGAHFYPHAHVPLALTSFRFLLNILPSERLPWPLSLRWTPHTHRLTRTLPPYPTLLVFFSSWQLSLLEMIFYMYSFLENKLHVGKHFAWLFTFISQVMREVSGI